MMVKRASNGRFAQVGNALTSGFDGKINLGRCRRVGLPYYTGVRWIQ